MDGPIRVGQDSLLNVMRPNRLDTLDKPNGPPEPVAQVRVLPGALCRGRTVGAVSCRGTLKSGAQSVAASCLVIRDR